VSDIPEQSSAKSNQNKSSLAGYHFLNTYQQCGWQWYLKYIRRLEPLWQSKYLSFGTAIHAGLEAFYASNMALDADAAVAAGMESLAALQSAYRKPEDYDVDVERLPRMLRKWHGTWAASDRNEYDLVAVENEIAFDLPFDIVMTVRPDVILRERLTSKIVVLEHKSTSKSVGQMATTVRLGLQVDAQILGVSQALGVSMDDVLVVPDVLYQRQSVVSCERPFAISRSKRELAEAAMHFAGLFTELTQKTAAVNADGSIAELPPEAIFERLKLESERRLGTEPFATDIDICA